MLLLQKVIHHNHKEYQEHEDVPYPIHKSYITYIDNCCCLHIFANYELQNYKYTQTFHAPSLYWRGLGERPLPIQFPNTQYTDHRQPKHTDGLARWRFQESLAFLA